MEQTNNLCLKGTVVSEPKMVELPNREGVVYRFLLHTERKSGAPDEVVVHVPVDEYRGLEVGETVAVYGKLRTLRDYKNGIMCSVCAYADYLTDGAELADEYVNKVEVSGTLYKEPKKRTTPKGTTITEFLLSNNTQSLTCIAWNKCAEFIGTQSRGAKMRVLGRLQSREYMKHLYDNSYEARTAYELSVYWLEVM